MEREVVLTGIGGQGVQLAAQVLGRAAVLEDRHVLLLGTYGGSMRGGNTDSTLVIADTPISSPPIVSHVWAGLVMHHQFWAPMRAKLRPGAVVVLNSTVVTADIDRDTLSVSDVQATRIALELGQPMAASMVLLGAFSGLTAIAGLEALVEAMRASVPSYRRQHLEINERALRTGFATMTPSASVAAWPATETA